MLNQQHTLTRLRAELEERGERKYWSYKKFGYLVCNYRNKNKKEKERLIPRNKFEVLSSRVIRYRVREKVRIRRNEMVEEIKCFRYWGVGHFKWEYPNIEVEKKRKRDEKVVYTASPQKVQQEKRLVYFLWKKVQKYSSVQGISPRSTALEQRG